jgi:esterase
MLRRVPARLHRELIGADPASWLVLAHGIYGAGANWRSVARKLVERRPEWGVVLVDLRLHGRSDSGEPPHDLAACAADVRALVDELPGIAAIGGHSFGGKVVLAMRELAPLQLCQTWVLDASPSAQVGAMDDPDNTVLAVLRLMEQLPKWWDRRDDFVAAVVAEGYARPFAQWLAMNVEAGEGGGYGLRLDLPSIRALLADYYARDLWEVAFDAKLPGTVEVVVAARSPVLSIDDRARLASAPTHVHVHDLEAGHWLHIEAPAQVVELLATHLPTPLR